MLDEIQDDTLAFLQSEIDKNKSSEQPPNNTEGGGLYYGPGSGKTYNRTNNYQNR